MGADTARAVPIGQFAADPAGPGFEDLLVSVSYSAPDDFLFYGDGAVVDAVQLIAPDGSVISSTAFDIIALPDGLPVAGRLVATRFRPTTAEFLYAVTFDPEAAYGGFVLTTLFFVGNLFPDSAMPLGEDSLLGALGTILGTATLVTGEIVPLPGGVFLLLSALGVGVLLRRRPP